MPPASFSSNDENQQPPPSLVALSVSSSSSLSLEQGGVAYGNPVVPPESSESLSPLEQDGSGWYEYVHTGDRNKSAMAISCVALIGWVSLLLGVLVAALFVVPKPEPIGVDHSDDDSSAYAKTCRANLFNYTHSWQDFEAKIATLTEDWCNIGTALSAGLIPTTESSTSCNCTSRTEASRPMDSSLQWQAAFHKNMQTLQKAATQAMATTPTTSTTTETSSSKKKEAQTPSLDDTDSAETDQELEDEADNVNWDIILLGDEFVERFYGSTSGMHRVELDDNMDVYDSIFLPPSRSSSGNNNNNNTLDTSGVEATYSNTSLHGLALGIAATQVPHLLFELQNGLLDIPNVNPSVWWIVVGVNDLLYAQCDYKGVLAGIIDLVSTISQQHPQATIVLNSLLPATPYQKVWTRTLQPLNEAMECFAAARYSNDGKTQFFNATSYFLRMSSSAAPYRRYESLFYDNQFLNADGYKVWGQAIVERVQQIQAAPTNRRR